MSLLATRLQNLRANSPNLSKATLRAQRYGAMDTYVAGNGEDESVVSEDLAQKAMTAVGRTLEVPVYNSESVTIGSSRTVTINDNTNTSAVYAVTFQTYSWGFNHIPARFMNNELAAQQDWNRQFTKFLYKLGTLIDQRCLVELAGAKTQVFADDLGYTVTGNKIVASQAEKDKLLGDLSVMMQANDYYGGQYHLIGNAGVQSQINQLTKNNVNQAEFKALEYADKMIHYTNNLANDADNAQQMYLVAPGHVGLVFRHERESILGTQLADGTTWGTTVLPLLNIPCSTYFREGVADKNTIDGAASADMTRVAVESYGFSIDIGYITAFNDDAAANASPVIAAGVTTA